jgi:transposase
VFGLGRATKIYVAVEAVDMRKGFEGLYGLVRDRLEADPLSGHLFLFSNRTRTRLKALAWDGTGLWGVRQAPGEGPFPLAESGRQVQRDHAAGRAGDTGEWSGYEAAPAA